MLDSIVIFFFFFPLNYRLLGHDKINVGKFMFYFSRNLRIKKKKGRHDRIILLYSEKGYVILFLV